jgi:hypothetical protein
MAATLPTAREVFSSTRFNFRTETFLDFRSEGAITQAIHPYEEATKNEIERSTSGGASHKAAAVIDAVTGFFDDFYALADSKGANKELLLSINRFIENEMTHLVHNFSKLFGDPIEELRAFVSLLDTRRNEAIWREVFTFYFHSRVLSQAPAELVAEFVSHFWRCYLICAKERNARGSSPYYTTRLLKIMDERIYQYFESSNGTHRYRDREFVELFERHTRAIAATSPSETRMELEQFLEIRGYERDRYKIS